MEEATRYSLCPKCDACPAVVIEREAVTIGEGDNVVRLSKDEWNVLVDAISRSELGRIEDEEE